MSEYAEFNQLFEELLEALDEIIENGTTLSLEAEFELYALKTSLGDMIDEL